MNGVLAFTISLALLPVPVAAADPCRAVTDEGWRPSGLGAGATFSGPVVHVIDGDSLCIAIGEGQEAWVEVRLSDFFAPETRQGGAAAKSTLEHLALGRRATCVAGPGSYDRIVSRCQIDGKSVGDAMRAAGASEGGNGTRRDYRLGSGLMAEPSRPAKAARSPTAFGMSCAQLRAAGGARRGEPGYRPEWDGDGDGIACEPYRGR